MDIRVENLGVMAGKKAILLGLDLEFSPGAANVILGPNGAGKSTLLRLLGLLDRPGRGEIFYDGRKLSSMTRSARTALRRRCGFVFQAPLLLAGDVEANLRFGARLRGLEVGPGAIARVLENTGLAGKENQEARLLSGGEKQRLQLARVMLLDPDFYLLDEPTANLDPLSVKNIEAAIARLAMEGKTVILATHNLTQARLLAGKIIFLQGGRLVQAGSADEVLSHPLSLDIAEFSAAENIIPGTLLLRDGRTMLAHRGVAEPVINRSRQRADLRPGGSADPPGRHFGLLGTDRLLGAQFVPRLRPGRRRPGRGHGAARRLQRHRLHRFRHPHLLDGNETGAGNPCLADLQGHFGAPAADGLKPRSRPVTVRSQRWTKKLLKNVTNYVILKAWPR